MCRRRTRTDKKEHGQFVSVPHDVVVRRLLLHQQIRRAIMKKCICIVCALMLLSPPAQSRVLKLGRNMNATSSYQSVIKLSTSTGSAEIVKPPEEFDCDANCQKCDKTTGSCLSCAIDRYISDNLCLVCPEKTYCDGENAIPNCTDVSCLSGATAEATDTGCCCIPVGCEGVSCKSGYSPAATSSGCCCV